MGHFASAELQVDFYLVTFIEEFFGVPDLGDVVMLVDVHAKFNFLDLTRAVLSFPLLFGEVVAEFAKVHNPAHGGLGGGGDFNKIETDGARLPESLLDAHHPQLLVGNAVDYTHLPRADAFVNANFL